MQIPHRKTICKSDGTISFRRMPARFFSRLKTNKNAFAVNGRPRSETKSTSSLLDDTLYLSFDASPCMLVWLALPVLSHDAHLLVYHERSHGLPLGSHRTAAVHIPPTDASPSQRGSTGWRTCAAHLFCHNTHLPRCSTRHEQAFPFLCFYRMHRTITPFGKGQGGKWRLLQVVLIYQPLTPRTSRTRVGLHRAGQTHLASVRWCPTEPCYPVTDLLLGNLGQQNTWHSVRRYCSKRASAI